MKLLLRSILFLLVGIGANLKPFSKTLILVSIKTFLLRLNKVLEQKYLLSIPLILLATFFGRFFHFQKLQNIDQFFYLVNMFPEVQGDSNGVSTPQNSFFIILLSLYLRTLREFKKINITASLRLL